jgi:hypothetical protein
MLYNLSIEERFTHLMKQIRDLAKATGKPSGFSIGNTAKVGKGEFYLTPLRNTASMVIGGVIVFSEKQAMTVSKKIDGKVDYVMVDVEKKVSNDGSLSGEPANVERAVRENIKKSEIWTYKGNDLSVDALDGFIACITKDDLRGVGGKKIAILGAGNLGCKLALRLVERGANVWISRRNPKKIKLIAKFLNCIKPEYTTACVTGTTNNEKVAKNAEILIGMTQGIPVVTKKMIECLAPNPILIDGGKGTFKREAIQKARDLGYDIYRLDVGAAIEGMLAELLATKQMVKKNMGRTFFKGEQVVSGGILGRKDEIVVDNAFSPKIVYGVADGNGDFIRKLDPKRAERIQRLQRELGRRN